MRGVKMLMVFAGLALAGSVFAILYNANKSGLALMLGKDGFVPSLPMHIVVWGALFLAILGSAAFPVALGFIQAKYDELHPAAPSNLGLKQPTPEEEKKARHQKDMLSFVSDVTFDHAGESPGQVSFVGASLYASDDIPGSDDFWVRSGRIDYEDGSSTDFSVGVLFDSRSWKTGDSRRLESVRGSEGVALENAIRTTKISDLVQGHLWTICLGLASAETSDKPESNEHLSDDRSYHLCKALVNLGYVRPDKVKGLGLGVAQSSSTSSVALSRQRTAIIIGVTPLQKLHAHDISVAATRLVTVNGVLLDRYSRSKSGYSIFENIHKGPYDGASSVTDSDDVTDLIGPDDTR